MQAILILLNVIGLVVALGWWYTAPSPEPIITALTLAGALVAQLVRSSRKQKTPKVAQKKHNTQQVQQTVNVYSAARPATSSVTEDMQDKSLAEKKNRIRILFIDDDTKFKVVSILKSNGWVNTKIVKDAMVDDDVVVQSDIIFVDIHGVGKLMQCKDEGLGLAMQIKRKYSSKRVVLYSAESHGDRFHAALKEVDSSLPKNAEPFEFLELIEQFCRK